ncbi:MAG: hypothetical protein LBR73_03985 [Oscillospiraceae bacterium]|jgi:lysophospholipase L1-like esterase|nr:hypothetical protein [Oscillospiraceae bacterium]
MRKTVVSVCKHILALCLAAALLPVLHLGGAAKAAGKQWVASWGTGLQKIDLALSEDFDIAVSGLATTVRVRFENGLTGDTVRLRFSNQFGSAAIPIESVTLARAAGESGSSIVEGSAVAVTFGGKKEGSIPAGKTLTSDAVSMSVKAGEELCVSYYLPYYTDLNTMGLIGAESYLSLGNQTWWTNQIASAPLYVMQISKTGLEVTPLLWGVDVYCAGRAIVVLGDSTTANYLPRMMADVIRQAGYTNVSVINTSITGNRMLSYEEEIMLRGPFGERLLDRLDRDLLSVPGATHVIVRAGGNDINHPRLLTHRGIAPMYTAKEINAGLKKVNDTALKNSITPIFVPYNGMKSFERTNANGERDLIWDAEIQECYSQLNAYIYKLNKQNGFTGKNFVSALNKLNDPWCMQPEYTIDGGHYNWDGMVKFSQIFPYSTLGLNIKTVKAPRTVKDISLWDEIIGWFG